MVSTYVRNWVQLWTDINSEQKERRGIGTVASTEMADGGATCYVSSTKFRFFFKMKLGGFKNASISEITSSDRARSSALIVWAVGNDAAGSQCLRLTASEWRLRGGIAGRMVAQTAERL